MEDTDEKVFSEGKIYQFVEKHQIDGMAVLNDYNELHYILKPGHEFFDEYFEVVK